jgi:protein-tyrosine phosphatase
MRASPAESESGRAAGDLSGLDLRQALTDANRLATRLPASTRRCSSALQSQYLPAVVHCTAGKDRRLRLGHDLRPRRQETVYEDFLLTNHYTAQKIERTLWTIRLFSLFRIDPEQVRPVLSVERGYLAAAFDEIAKQYGSFDAYRRDALGLDDAETAAFRRLALE